jgi:transcription elongation factor
MEIMEIREPEEQKAIPYISSTLKTNKQPGMVAHAFNPSTWEAEAGRFLSSSPAWSTSRTARATEKPCLEKQNKTNQPTKQTKQKSPLLNLHLSFW